MLADRLTLIAPKIISDQQWGFLKGRHITECIYTTSEAINLLDNRSFGGNISLKFDIKDTLDWNFLLKVLKAFGFHFRFCEWIWTILHSAKLSFIVNGSIIGYFDCKRGVRQGGTLSPLLFCLAEDVLSRSISLLVQCNQLKPMTGPRGFSTPSHVFYANDVMVFCQGTKKNLSTFLALFSEYVEASGRFLSFESVSSTQDPCLLVESRN